MIELFSALGLEEREQKLYLALAEVGKGTAQLLSKKCSLPRTTTYFALGRLMEMGLVVEEHKKRTTYYSPQPPTAFQRLVDREEEKVRARRTAADELVKILPPFFKSKLYSVPTVEFYEGRERIKDMLYTYLPHWYESMRSDDNTWWGYQDRDFVKEYRSYLEQYWKMKEEKQRVYLLSNASDLEKEIQVPNRIIKAVSENASFTSTFWVCGAYIVVIAHRHSPRYAFQLKDSVLASNMKAVFKMLWELL